MSLLEADLKYIWHPAQQMKDAEVFPPVVIDPYYNQLIAMAFYTVINFIMNKFYTFKA